MYKALAIQPRHAALRERFLPERRCVKLIVYAERNGNATLFSAHKFLAIQQEHRAVAAVQQLQLRARLSADITERVLLIRPISA